MFYIVYESKNYSYIVQHLNSNCSYGSFKSNQFISNYTFYSLLIQTNAICTAIFS